MNKRALALLVGILLAQAPAAASHHAAAAAFDLSRTSTIRGVFSKVAWINPHVGFEVQADGPGKAPWRFETRPPGYFTLEGVKLADLEGLVGQEVTVLANPARDGSKRGWALKLTFADGAQLVLPGE
jgi:hypothetical protein